jgi:hypothetical protein
MNEFALRDVEHVFQEVLKHAAGTGCASTGPHKMSKGGRILRNPELGARMRVEFGAIRPR